MPCHVDLSDDKIDFEAVLCGIFTLLESNKLTTTLGTVLTAVDWDEVGENRSDIRDWWIEHKRRDAERRVAEAKRKAMEESEDRKKLKKLIAKYGVPE